jgi:nucleotide-binding universal stress UspA family protein
MLPVLVAYNAATDDRGPVEFGIAAARVLGAPLTVLWVHRGGEAVDEADRHRVERLRADLARHGRPADVHAVAGWSVGVEVSDAAARIGAQMVVLGTTRRSSAQATLLGTAAEHVLRDATCPVAVVPRDYATPAPGIQVVGAAYAPSPEGRFALRWAAGLARAGGVALRALHVVEPGRAAGEAAVDARVEFVHGDPVDALLAAGRELDLLVLGSRGGDSSGAELLGGVARKVAERATCPVLILPRAAQVTADGLLTEVADSSA